MKDNIIEFMNKTEMLSKEISIYKDEEKGIIFPLNTVNLLARVDYLELDKQEYTVAKFQNKIEDLSYTIEEIERPVPKNEITKKEEDKFTITTKKVSVRKVWNVSNGAGIIKSFTKKEDAIKLVEEINNKVLDKLK